MPGRSRRQYCRYARHLRSLFARSWLCTSCCIICPTLRRGRLEIKGSLKAALPAQRGLLRPPRSPAFDLPYRRIKVACLKGKAMPRLMQHNFGRSFGVFSLQSKDHVMFFLSRTDHFASENAKSNAQKLCHPNSRQELQYIRRRLLSSRKVLCCMLPETPTSMVCFLFCPFVRF